MGLLVGAGAGACASAGDQKLTIDTDSMTLASREGGGPGHKLGYGGQSPCTKYILAGGGVTEQLGKR